MKAEYLWTSFDGLKYQARSWQAEGRVMAVICIVHGIGEHSMRYDEWAGRFYRNGYHVLSFDYRGHGESEGKRGHTPSYEALMKDVDLLMTKAGEIFPGIPVVLYGHSMGGNLVLNYIISRKLKNIPLIVTSPWLKLAFEPPAFKLFMAKLVRKILPGLLQSTGLKTKDLTKNNSVVDKYENDELVHGKISVNMFFEMYQAGYRVLDNAEKIKCPVLLMHGTEDGICSWQGSSELASKAKGNITFKTWEGLYHELHNEAEQDKVFMFIISWLEKL